MYWMKVNGTIIREKIIGLRIWFGWMSNSLLRNDEIVVV